MDRTLIVLRLGLAALFFWFGFQQWLNPGAWAAFLPAWTGYLPIPTNALIMANGWMEIVGATALVLGIWVRPVSALLGVHLLGIAISAGGAIGVRDAALAVSAISLSLSSSDRWTLDRRWSTTKAP